MQYAIYTPGFLTFVDIYVPNSKLCVYVDGEYWHKNSQEKDLGVNKKLMDMGYKVIRFQDREIKENLQECLKKILFLVN